MAWVGYLAASAVILVSGFHLCRETDALAARRGWTRSWAGLVLLATVTSFPELLTGLSAVTAADAPRIALGDVVGSLAFNLVILGALAMVGRRRIFQVASPGHREAVAVVAAVTAFALVLVLVGGRWGPLAAWALLVLPALYLAAMWHLHRRGLVAPDESSPASPSLTALAVHAALLVVAAAALPYVGATIADSTGLGRTFVGGLFIAVGTSLPEVAVTLAAWRIGAPDLAIGNLVGSNLFDLAILGIDEAAYQGNLLAVVEPGHVALLLAALMMTLLTWVALRFPQRVSGRLVGAAIVGLYVAAQALSFAG